MLSFIHHLSTGEHSRDLLQMFSYIRFSVDTRMLTQPHTALLLLSEVMGKKVSQSHFICQGAT